MPNTYRDKVRVGKGNTLFYALLIGVFLVWQSLDIQFENNQLSVKSKDIPIANLVVCSSTLLIILGFNIKDELFAIAAIVNRNSALINDIAAKNNMPLSEADNDSQITDKNE